MNMFTIFVLVMTGLLALAGCGDRSGMDEKIVTNAAAPGTAVAPALAVPVTPRYEATLAEGIDFRKGYPNFVAQISGMSALEPWGSWTAGPVAKFRFTQALPKKFTLEIAANAFGPNTGAPVIVRVGNVEKTFIITNKEPNTYRLQFEVDGTIDSLEFTPPKPTSPSEILPNNGDTRKLGIGFISLKISE